MELLLPLAVGTPFGILTAALAKRYERNVLGWGLFGLVLFLIALPLLLYLGRNIPPAQQTVLDAVAAHGHVTFEELSREIGLDDESLMDALDELLDKNQVLPTPTGFAQPGFGALDALLPRPSDSAPDESPESTAANSVLWPPPPPPPMQQYSSAEGPDPAAAERLRRLAQLHSDGLITQDEYQQKRRQILEQL